MQLVAWHRGCFDFISMPLVCLQTVLGLSANICVEVDTLSFVQAVAVCRCKWMGQLKLRMFSSQPFALDFPRPCVVLSKRASLLFKAFLSFFNTLRDSLVLSSPYFDCITSITGWIYSMVLTFGLLFWRRRAFRSKSWQTSSFILHVLKESDYPLWRRADLNKTPCDQSSSSNYILYQLGLISAEVNYSVCCPVPCNLLFLYLTIK